MSAEAHKRSYCISTKVASSEERVKENSENKEKHKEPHLDGSHGGWDGDENNKSAAMYGTLYLLLNA